MPQQLQFHVLGMVGVPHSIVSGELWPAQFENLNIFSLAMHTMSMWRKRQEKYEHGAPCWFFTLGYCLGTDLAYESSGTHS